MIRQSNSGFDLNPLSTAELNTIEEFLPRISKDVCFHQGTERSFSGKTVNGYSYDCHEKGTYVCAVGGLPLFHSDDKFDSGTGWPSFCRCIDEEHVKGRQDATHGMVRGEVLCARSGAHLGHVFEDGPRPTGLRYCINAAALRFVPDGTPIDTHTWNAHDTK